MPCIPIAHDISKDQRLIYLTSVTNDPTIERALLSVTIQPNRCQTYLLDWVGRAPDSVKIILSAKIRRSADKATNPACSAPKILL